MAASCLKHTIYGDANLATVEEVEKLMSGDGVGGCQDDFIKKTATIQLFAVRYLQFAGTCPLLGLSPGALEQRTGSSSLDSCFKGIAERIANG